MNQPKSAGAPTLSNIGEILDEIVKSVVKYPEKAGATMSEHGSLVAFVIKADKEDVRRVVGKSGKHIRALTQLANAMSRRYGKESHVMIDEKSPPIAPAPNLAFTYEEYDPVKFDRVRSLLHRIFNMLVIHRDAIAVVAGNVSTTTILEVNVKTEDYPLIYGPEADFDYGRDGLIIGSIKNIFDGIGKNHGRVIRLVVNKV